MRLVGGACLATFVFMLDALVPDSGQAFAQAAPPSQGAGPRFRADGPNADEFGRKEGYPSCKGLDYVHQTRCRVGAFSRYDTRLPGCLRGHGRGQPPIPGGLRQQQPRRPHRDRPLWPRHQRHHANRRSAGPAHRLVRPAAASHHRHRPGARGTATVVGRQGARRPHPHRIAHAPGIGLRPRVKRGEGMQAMHLR